MRGNIRSKMKYSGQKIAVLAGLVIFVCALCGCEKREETIETVSLNLSVSDDSIVDTSDMSAENDADNDKNIVSEEATDTEKKEGEKEWWEINPYSGDVIENYDQISSIAIVTEEREINIVSYRDDFPRELQDYMIFHKRGFQVDEVPPIQTGHSLKKIDEQTDESFLAEYDFLLEKERHFDMEHYPIVYRADVSGDGKDDYIVKYFDWGRYPAMSVLVKTDDGWENAGGRLNLDIRADMDIYVIDNEYYLYMGDMIAKGNGKKLPDDPIEIVTLDDAMKKTGVFEIAYLEKTVTGYNSKQNFCDPEYTDGIEESLIENLDIDSTLAGEYLAGWGIYNGYFDIYYITERASDEKKYCYMFGKYEDRLWDQYRNDILLLLTVEIDKDGNKKVVSIYQLTGNYDMGVK